MRKLKTSDILAFCRCLKHIGVQEDIRGLAQRSTNVKDAWDKGFDLVWGIFDKATEEASEHYLYEFLAGPFCMTAEEVADLPIPDLIKDVQQLAEDNDLGGFFNSAAVLIQKK